MPTFKYKARKQGGQIVDGTLEAASASAAANHLLSTGTTPIRIEAAKESPEGLGDLLEKLFPPRVKLEDLIVLCRQLYTLTKAGVPITRTISGLSDTTRNTTLAKALADVTASLESGRDLTTSLTQHPKVFPTLMISIVQVGENTGQLDTAFMQVAGYFEAELETRKRLKQATRYPIMVLGAVAVALGVINLFVIPAFAKVFESFHAELPLPTRILMGTSSFCVQYWIHILVCMAGAVFGFKQWAHTERGRYWIDKYKLRLPVIGSIVERATLARFSRSFAMSMSAGVPLIQTLLVIARTVDNDYVSEKILGMRNIIEHGESLTNSAAQSGLFTPLVLQMMAVGEATGSIDDLLVEVADFYEREVDYDLTQLSDAIEPIMLVILGAIVLVLALGVYLPMWNLSQAVKP